MPCGEEDEEEEAWVFELRRRSENRRRREFTLTMSLMREYLNIQSRVMLSFSKMS